MSVQLPLGLSLKDGATFENFVAGPNQGAVRTLEQCIAHGEHPAVYLWGAAGTGKTHLLQAACYRMAQRGQPVAYLPLGEASEFRVDALQGLESMPLICIDDVHSVAGDMAWEEALFDLFNRMYERGHCLIFAAIAGPAEIGLGLADLASRLAWGPVFHLRQPDDADKLQALVVRAGERGLDLPEEVGRYLLRHYPRDMKALLRVLDRLDSASMVAQRRLTIPFVKQALEQQEQDGR